MDCNSDEFLTNIIANCIAVKRPGGVKPGVYMTRVENIAGMLVDATTKTLNTLTLKAGAKFIKLEGRKFRNTAGTEYTKAENGPSLRAQSFKFEAFTHTQIERNAVEALIDQEGMVVFVPTNGGQVKVYGYSMAPYESVGLDVTTASESEGQNLNDSTSWTLNFTGAEMNFSVLYQEAAGIPATLDYLDALVTA